uniref:Ferritin n=2 Tax=Macrostomum lignano TaxID=282301 RepID=A0A1I8HRJ8_9PLAT
MNWLSLRIFVSLNNLKDSQFLPSQVYLLFDTKPTQATMARLSLLSAILLHLVVVSMQQGDDETLDIRQRFNSTSVSMINDQIQREFNAMYLYETMASYFGRPSVGLPGFKKFFKKAADEEREHAHKLIDYLNMRGGHVKLKPITPPSKFEWFSALDAAETALGAEKNITLELYRLRDRADKESDPHLVDFIESEFLTEQVTGIRDLRELIARLNKAGSGLGELIVDKELN